MPKSNDTDILGYLRPVIRENFGSEFAHAAGTPGAPERPHDVTGIVTTKSKNIISDIQKDAGKCYLKMGHMVMTSLALTDLGILDTAESLSTTLVLQKFSPSAPLIRRYANIASFYPRTSFPGNVMSHLVRRDGQNDFGMTEGVRFLGNYYGNNVMRVNEKRPLLHDKIVVFLEPNKKGVLTPKVSWRGSANITENANFSFEGMVRSEDPKVVMAEYLTFCHYYSLSEGLFNFSGGLVPTYRWEPKVTPFAKPKCSSCKSQHLVTRWFRTEEHSNEHRRYLVCTECQERVPFLEEHAVVL